MCKVTDTDIWDNSTENDNDTQWIQDSCEIFVDVLDTDCSGCSSEAIYMNSNHYHFLLSAGGYVWDERGTTGSETSQPDKTWDCTTCTYGVGYSGDLGGSGTGLNNNDNQYWVGEFKIPWTEIIVTGYPLGYVPTNGDQIRVSMAYNDRDTSATGSFGWYLYGGITTYFQNVSKWSQSIAIEYGDHKGVTCSGCTF